MGWVKEALKELQQGNDVTIRPYGGSMRGLIESGQAVTLTSASIEDVSAGDIVLVKWKGNYLLHLIGKKEADQVLICNNLGKVNGWVNGEAILAKVTNVR